MNTDRYVLSWKGQQISLCVSTLIVILLSLTKLVHTSGNDVLVQAFADRFSQSSTEEALEIWHTDCHRRCRVQLIEHVNVACTFDPYKIFITKRSVNSSMVPIIPASEKSSGSPPFLSKHTASSFLATRGKGTKVKSHSRQKRGVMEECCYFKSCSWEEYAEFCHTYNRRPTARTSNCYR
ncbi:probable insulin-like peptide 7 [Patella vulgata]|uniref:probable insulin-like peptide 7 n=1 Tax=Patella vulgata TaxID=6465 RepID=UPI0024A92FFF|nr:probable insulin-like peptide 7 [Patella vulgata]